MICRSYPSFLRIDLAASKISPWGAGEATTVIFLSSTFGAAVVAVSFDWDAPFPHATNVVATYPNAAVLINFEMFINKFPFSFYIDIWWLTGAHSVNRRIR